MQGCLPLNAINATKIGSTMCTKLACISKSILLHVDSNIFHLGERLVLMGVMQCVNKSCPFKVDDSLFDHMVHFQEPLNH
jgi:hypothetical protein